MYFYPLCILSTLHFKHTKTFYWYFNFQFSVTRPLPIQTYIHTYWRKQVIAEEILGTKPNNVMQWVLTFQVFKGCTQIFPDLHRFALILNHLHHTTVYFSWIWYILEYLLQNLLMQRVLIFHTRLKRILVFIVCTLIFPDLHRLALT